MASQPGGLEGPADIGKVLITEKMSLDSIVRLRCTHMYTQTLKINQMLITEKIASAPTSNSSVFMQSLKSDSISLDSADSPSLLQTSVKSSIEFDNLRSLGDLRSGT